MKKLMQGGLVTVAVIACASFVFAGTQPSVSDNTLVKSLISGKMTQADSQLVAQTAIPRTQATANAAKQQTAQQKKTAAEKAKQAQQQAARQQQAIRQQQLQRQQQIIRQQRLQAARQQQAAAAAQQHVATAAPANEAVAFESFEATFVAPEAVSDISAATEQAVQNVEETLSPSAPTSSN